MAVALTLVTNKNKYTKKETIQKHSKRKYTYYQNTHTIVKTQTLSKHPKSLISVRYRQYEQHTVPQFPVFSIHLSVHLTLTVIIF